MQRLPNWRGRLAAFLAARRRLGFSWAEGRDCCLLCADAIVAIASEDLAAPLRGYATRFGAARALVRLGCGSVVDFLDARLPRIARPRCGDLVLMKAEAPLDFVAIADRGGHAWGQGPDGLVRWPIPAGAIAWAVG